MEAIKQAPPSINFVHKSSADARIYVQNLWMLLSNGLIYVLMWIAFHNPSKLGFARRAKTTNLKQSNPKGVQRVFFSRGGVLERM